MHKILKIFTTLLLVTFSLHAENNSTIEEKCLSGSPQDCYAAGLSYAQDDSLKDTEGTPNASINKSIEFYEKGCALGHADSCFELGIIYSSSRENNPVDRAKAKQRYAKSCNMGNIDGCYNLAILYTETPGADQEKAVSLFEKSCKANVGISAQGCFNAGLIYTKGDESITERNYPKAKNYYDMACKSGFVPACYNLGVFYLTGKGTKKNYNKASKMFIKSCTDIYSKGCFNLGILYSNGKGVKQSYEKAKELFGLACDGGNPQGCNNYAGLKTILGRVPVSK